MEGLEDRDIEALKTYIIDTIDTGRMEVQMHMVCMVHHQAKITLTIGLTKAQDSNLVARLMDKIFYLKIIWSFSSSIQMTLSSEEQQGLSIKNHTVNG